jgi:hypothetical protein
VGRTQDERRLTQTCNACQDFLTLWKDADRDIPILKEAKIEDSTICSNAKPDE